MLRLSKHERWPCKAFSPALALRQGDTAPPCCTQKSLHRFTVQAFFALRIPGLLTAHFFQHFFNGCFQLLVFAG